ncbi:MAG: ethanolamine ammonia-lyase reactivating factor EutA [Dehalococcoidia bacterium]
MAEQEHTHSGMFMGLHSHDGGPAHWHDEFGEHSAEGLSEEEIAARQLDWRMHNVELVTIGMDIGSATSHVMFSKIFIQLVGEPPHVSSVVVGREVLWQSPIILTPYREDNTIDTDVLTELLKDAYIATQSSPNDVDTGAIILTGEALKRENARAIGNMFAIETGKFVRATAGHHLEAVLAANGSGTVARSRRDARTLLNVDIGGGTTKLAVVEDGEILGTAAVAIGARLIVKDDQGRVARIAEPAQLVADHVGVKLVVGEPLAPSDEAKIIQCWMEVLGGLIEGKQPEGIAAELMLTDPLPDDVDPQAVTFSGGVSEFIFGREEGDFGDLGPALAKAIRRSLGNGTIPLPAIIDPNLGIRATAIGASLFTVQVGINSYVSDESVLPLSNVPVLAPKLKYGAPIEAAVVAAAIHDAAVRADFEQGDHPVALSIEWPGGTDEASVQEMAQGIRDGLAATIDASIPVVILVDQAVTRGLGAELKERHGVPGAVIALERVTVSEFDFLDVQPVVHPSEVVPVTVKSLLFAGGLDRRSVKTALINAALKK